MKDIFLTIFFLTFFLTNYAQKLGTFLDNRDNKIYKTVEIGNQTWMAENLAYKTENGCFSYDNLEKYVKRYGYLYDWQTAQQVCPTGWHLSSRPEWDTLFLTIGGTPNQVPYAKKICKKYSWKSSFNKWSLNPTNEFNFNAVPAGIMNYLDTTYSKKGLCTIFWTSSLTKANNNENNEDYAVYTIEISYDIGIFILDAGNKKSAYSVRCIKN